MEMSRRSSIAEEAYSPVFIPDNNIDYYTNYNNEIEKSYPLQKRIEGEII